MKKSSILGALALTWFWTTPLFAPAGPVPAPPAPPAPGAGVPELSTGAVGSGLVVVLGAMLVFADYRKRKAKKAGEV